MSLSAKYIAIAGQTICRHLIPSSSQPMLNSARMRVTSRRRAPSSTIVCCSPSPAAFQTFDLSVPDFQYAGAVPNPYAGVPINAPHALTGDASLAYLFPRTNTKLRGHVGNAYRAPGLYERFGAGFYNNPFVPGEVVFTPYGDPRLAPDRFNSVDGGIDQYLFHDRIRVSGPRSTPVSRSLSTS